MTPGHLATLACIAEVTAPKLGNVHPDAPFDDMDHTDFVVSALVCEPLLDQAAQRGVGRTIYDAAKATHEAVGVNTNLGLLMLLAPLCAGKLSGFTQEDARYVYDAIDLVAPGGVGQAERPHVTLDDAMAMAAPHDLIARQYLNGFADVNRMAKRLGQLYADQPLPYPILDVQIETLASELDSHLVRKGRDAKEVRRRARALMQDQIDFDAFDAWLREGRNPGTTADLIGAALFVALRDGLIPHPWKWELDE